MRRSGFTLIELLVVMGIIAIVAGLSFVAATSFLTNARENATEVTIKKVDAILQDRMTALTNYCEESDRRCTSSLGLPSRPPSYILPLNVSPMKTQMDVFREAIQRGDYKLVKILKLKGKKDFFRRIMPMTFEEADMDLDGKTDVTNNQGVLVDVSTLSSLGHKSETESAEVMYWFLTNGPQVGNAPVGTGDFLEREIGDTDGDGLLELLDGWGRPLRFYRWPTRLIRQPVSGNPQDSIADFSKASINVTAASYLISTLPPLSVLMSDPDDPTAALTTAYTPEVFEKNLHTMRTWHAPLIMSVGEDGENGLHEPEDFLNFGQLAQPKNLPDIEDNISNLFLRTGGR